MRVTEIMVNTPTDCITIVDLRETQHVTLAIMDAKERHPDWTSMVISLVQTKPLSGLELVRLRKAPGLSAAEIIGAD